MRSESECFSAMIIRFSKENIVSESFRQTAAAQSHSPSYHQSVITVYLISEVLRKVLLYSIWFAQPFDYNHSRWSLSCQIAEKDSPIKINDCILHAFLRLIILGVP